MNASGTALVYTTFLSGSNISFGRAIAVDNSGEAVIAGQTSSSDFPVMNAIQPVNAGGDEAFVSKLSADGSALIFSTYQGGSGNESVNSVAVDTQSNVYVTGSTSSSTSFPRVNAVQNTYGGPSDVFVTKYTPNEQAYLYSTFLGGDQGFAGDKGYGIAADGAGNEGATALPLTLRARPS